MGEAKNRLDSLGPTRKLLVERADLLNLITLFMQPDEHGKIRVVGDRLKRRALNSAMAQLGVLEVWRKVRKGGGNIQAIIDQVELAAIKDVSVDAIRTIQDMLSTALDFRDAMNLADFEDMLESALAGTYQVEEPAPALALVDDAPEDPPPPVEEPAPAPPPEPAP